MFNTLCILHRHLVSIAILVLLPFVALAQESADSLPIPSQVQVVFKKFCAECHDGNAKEGEVSLSKLTSGELKIRLDLLNRLQEQLHFGLMPPKDSLQPTPIERQLLAGWIRGELLKLMHH